MHLEFDLWSQTQTCIFFSAKIGDEGGLHVTSGRLHFPSQEQDIYVADFKVALRK